MIDAPFFSIIIPTYNRSTSLINCLLKIKQQTYQDWECIIIDDGSTDNTLASIDEFLINNTNIFYYYQQNSERSVARNNGASKAKGEYLIFLDSDDEFEVNHLELVYKHISRTNFIKGMYFTNGKIKKTNSIEIIDAKNIPPILPIDYFLNHSVIPARVCLHNSVLSVLHFDPRAIIVEDTVLWTEILGEFPVNYIPIDTVIYNWHGDNSVNIEKNNAYHLRLKGLKVLFYKKKIGEKIKQSIKNKHLNRCYLGIAEYYAHKKTLLKSIFWILISIVKYPRLDTKHKIQLLIKGYEFD